MKLDDVRAIEYGDVLVEGERWPNSIHVIEHPDGRILVDTGMIDSTPELDEQWGIRFDPEKIPRDVVCVVNTHLHFDPCGGNRLFLGTPIHVQRVEREAARERARSRELSSGLRVAFRVRNFLSWPCTKIRTGRRDRI